MQKRHSRRCHIRKTKHKVGNAKRQPAYRHPVIREILREMRRQKLSYAKLAARMGQAHHYRMAIWRMLHEHEDVRFSTIIALANALGLSLTTVPKARAGAGITDRAATGKCEYCDMTEGLSTWTTTGGREFLVCEQCEMEVMV